VIYHQISSQYASEAVSINDKQQFLSQFPEQFGKQFNVDSLPLSKEGQLSPIKQTNESPKEDLEQPLSKERLPFAKEEKPLLKEKRPSFKEEQSSSKEEQPSPKEEQPLLQGERPSPKEKQGTIIVSENTLTKNFTTFLLIMVPVLPKSFHSREVIRNTWYKGLRDSKDVMLRFAIGTAGLVDINVVNKLATENRTFGDLIYFDKHKESKMALTEKTLLMMQWADCNVQFSYFLKCDDETFVFIDKLIAELKKRPLATRLYYGLIRNNSKPHQSGPWADKKWKLGSTYLPYALGGGYILSSDLIKLIVENIDYLQWHPNEDTAVGSWLAPYKIELRNDKLICVSFGEWRPDDGCPKNQVIHIFNNIERSKQDEIMSTLMNEM